MPSPFGGKARRSSQGPCCLRLRPSLMRWRPRMGNRRFPTPTTIIDCGTPVRRSAGSLSARSGTGRVAAPRAHAQQSLPLDLRVLPRADRMAIGGCSGAAHDHNPNSDPNPDFQTAASAAAHGPWTQFQGTAAGQDAICRERIPLEFGPGATAQVRNALVATFQLAELETQTFALTGRRFSRIDSCQSVPVTPSPSSGISLPCRAAGQQGLCGRADTSTGSSVGAGDH